MTPISIQNNSTETVPPPGSVAPSVEGQNGNGYTPNDNPPEVTALERHILAANRGDVASVSFFDSVEELQDIAVGLAFADEGEQNIINELETLHQNRTQDLERQYRAQEGFQRTLIAITSGKISRETNTLTDAMAKASALEDEERRLKDEVQILSNEINLNLQELTQERLQHEHDFFEAEIRRLQSRQRQKEAVEDVCEEFALAEKVYELKQRQWQLNQTEFKRIADDADAEKKNVEKHLEEVRGRLNRFQQLGVSRTTAGFLVHAGYASFAAVGALIAGFFHQRQGSGGDFLSRIIGGIRNLIGLSEGGWAVWPSLFNLVLLIGFGILVVTATTVIMNWLIGKLDSNWPRGSARGRRSEQSRSIADLFKRVTARLGSLFQKNNQDTQQSSRNRSAKQDEPQLDRRAFVQLLAHMPYVIGAALVFFFLASLGLSNNGQPAGTAIAPLEISSTYIGVIFLTLTTSVAILYVTNVIEPRWLRYENRQQFAKAQSESAPAQGQGDTQVPPKDQNGLSQILKLNWEFLVLVAVLIASLALAAFLPIDPRFNSWALGSVAIFMSLSSLGLAYGLVQRGLFKDFDVLEGKRQVYRKQSDYYNQYPKIEGVFDSFDNKEVGERFRESRLTQHKLDELRMLSELNRIFGDDFEDDAKLEDFLAQFVTTDISLKGMKRKAPIIDPLDGKFPVALDKIKAIYSQRERRGLVGSKIGAIRGELEKLRAHTEKLNTDLDRLCEVLVGQELELIGVTQVFSERRQELDIKHKKEIMKLKSAYRIGKTAYRLVHPPRTNGVAA
jgi:hypothetical protein